MAALNPIAMSEDEPLAWYPRAGISWLVAMRAFADDMMTPTRRCYARRRFMRPARHEDCPAWPHGRDEDGEAPDDCRCWLIEDGRHYECSAGDPDAIPVWRVAERAQLRYRFWDFMRRRVYSSTDILGKRPVLWGGRLHRRANWLDRLLIGAMPGTTIHCGDHWLKPGETELLWCGSCRATTPHDVPRYGSRPWCLATNHGVSKAAPLAEDLRDV
jgi:hypothetical protein